MNKREFAATWRALTVENQEMIARVMEIAIMKQNTPDEEAEEDGESLHNNGH